MDQAAIFHSQRKEGKCKIIYPGETQVGYIFFILYVFGLILTSLFKLIFGILRIVFTLDKNY